MDVAQAGSIASAIATVTSQVGQLDILVNNAGVTTTRAFLDLEEAEWDQILDINLKGCFLVAQEAARAMVRLGHGGATVNVASILGLRVAGQVAPYSASEGRVGAAERGDGARIGPASASGSTPCAPAISRPI